MTREDAIAIASSYLDDLQKAEPDERLVLLKESTLETDVGWVFFYDTESSRREGNFYVGNAPFLVDRRTATVHDFGTAESVESYLEKYRRYGNPFHR